MKYDYKAYSLHVQQGIVRVYDPRFPNDSEVYQAPSLDQAMRWIDAYRDGQHWAMQAALKPLQKGVLS